MRFFLSVVLLSAAASAEVFNLVVKQGQSTVYEVRGAVTVGVQKLTGEKTALEYNGTLAIERIREGEYLAKFNQFKLNKYNKIDKSVNDDSFDDTKPDQQERGTYEQQMQKPVKFSMKGGKVMQVEAESDHQQWSLNIFRSIFTLLQNQAHKPSDLSLPSIMYKYEDGITGHCKVQYEVLSQPEEETSETVYNVSKTVDYKDCLERPVYLYSKDKQVGCAGVCDNHKPENFVAQYEEEQTDYELRPTPGCPANHQRKDSLVSVTNVAKYNVTDGRLDEANTESVDIYRLYGGEIEVFTQLRLRFLNSQGPKIEEPRNTKKYNTLQQRLPIQEAKELDVPIYALLKEHSKHMQYPQYFQKHFDTVLLELSQMQTEQRRSEQGQKQEGFKSAAYMVELIQAISAMTEEELMKATPEVVRNKPAKKLSEEQNLRRQLWIELLGKAGSKTAVNIATKFIKNKIFTPSETRRILQDIASFQAYPDTEMIEELLNLCTLKQGLTAAGKAAACAAAGKVISKACSSKVTEHGWKEQQKGQLMNGQQMGTEIEQSELNMARLSTKPQLRCTPQHLQQYIERLSMALRQSRDFKQAVAYINGLAKVQKPEVLPELMGYVNGTASNMDSFSEKSEQQDESNEFMRRVAIVSLGDIATQYPKEVNPIVRVIYENTTEQVQTRLNAFDVWMNTQPAQWEVEKVMQIANKDTSLELTHYVYTALKSAMHAKEPCYQLLAQRIRAAWSQMRPFDFGMKYSQLRSESFYDPVEDFGVRGIWKVMTSNTTVLPAFSQLKLDHVHGPYMKTLFGVKLLVKGGDKVWEGLTGKDGLLERIAHAVNGQIKTGERQMPTEKLLKDMTDGMKMKHFNKETPKAVLFWKLLSGETVIPMDAEYVMELKQELLESVSMIGKEGITGHLIRLFVPSKAFHVEPTPMGFPVVHSTIHPIMISVHYENLKVNYKNQEGSALPELFELTGSIRPTVVSFRQSRVFVAEKQGQISPTLKLSDIKELSFGVSLKIGFNLRNQRVQASVKPNFERVLHSAFCTELKLEKNTIIDGNAHSHSYGKCIKSLREPIRSDQEIGGKQLGMILRLSGESHYPWSGLSILGSKYMHRNGMVAALLNQMSNKGMKHHSMSLYLEADEQQPMDEWCATIDMDSNVEALAKIPLKQQAETIQKVNVQYQRRSQEQLDAELQGVIRKADGLLQKNFAEIQATTIEQQLLAKLEGRNGGQTKNTIRVAMKKINNFEKTEQQIAIAAECQQSRGGIEIYSNVSYPKIGSVFRFDPTFAANDERMNGTLAVILQGKEKQIYRVTFEATKSEEQRRGSELEWYEIRCLAEQKAGKTFTDACKKAILKDNSLDHMQMTIQLPNNVHPTIEQLGKRALNAIKHQFYGQMSTEISGRQDRQPWQQQQLKRHEQQTIRIFGDASRMLPWSLLYNVRIEMPRENVTLSNIRLPGVRPIHMQLSTMQQLEHVLASGEFENVCSVGRKNVQTFDNVTFGLDVRTGCEYVLSQDRSTGPTDFIVTMQIVNQETDAKKLVVYLQNTKIEFEPFSSSDNQFNVNINGTHYKLTTNKPVTFHYGGKQNAHVSVYDTLDNSPQMKLYTESKDLQLTFDGHSCQTAVSDRYKGHVNGICGNNDNEQNHEFIGPRGREFTHSNEFIASYGIGRNCQIPVENSKEKMMKKLNNELERIQEQEQLKIEKMKQQMYNTRHFQSHSPEWQEELKEMFGEPRLNLKRDQESSQEEDVKERYTLRTLVSIEGSDACFSAEPVATCKQGYRKQGILRTQRMQSLCIPKSSAMAVEGMRRVHQRIPVDVSQIEKDQITGRLIAMVNIPNCVRHD